MELGTGTTDANMDEWLEVCSLLIKLPFRNATHVSMSRINAHSHFTLQGTSFAQRSKSKKKQT